MHVWFLVLILWLYYCYIITIMNQLWLNTWLAFHSQELAGYRIMRNNKYIPLKKNSRKISVAPYFLIFKSSAINWCIGLIIKCLIHFSQTRNSWMHSSERIVNIFKQTHNLAQNGCGIILFPYIEYLETKWKLVYECQTSDSNFTNNDVLHAQSWKEFKHIQNEHQTCKSQTYLLVDLGSRWGVWGHVCYHKKHNAV